jgi:catechol 2,3-dioxygenase-like lactoylglutathione lyase family enzyme
MVAICPIFRSGFDPSIGEREMRLNQVTVTATDLARSIGFYEQLGLKLIVRSEHYARFELPEGGSTFSLHAAPEGPGDNAPVIYFECDDLDAVHARLAAAGVAFDLAPTDQSWLWREAHLRDPAGNALILYFAGENRTHPPWRIG